MTAIQALSSLREMEPQGRSRPLSEVSSEGVNKGDPFGALLEVEKKSPPRPAHEVQASQKSRSGQSSPAKKTEEGQEVQKGRTNAQIETSSTEGVKKEEEENVPEAFTVLGRAEATEGDIDRESATLDVFLEQKALMPLAVPEFFDFKKDLKLHEAAPMSDQHDALLNRMPVNEEMYVPQKGDEAQEKVISEATIFLDKPLPEGEQAFLAERGERQIKSLPLSQEVDTPALNRKEQDENKEVVTPSEVEEIALKRGELVQEKRAASFAKNGNNEGDAKGFSSDFSSFQFEPLSFVGDKRPFETLLEPQNRGQLDALGKALHISRENGVTVFTIRLDEKEHFKAPVDVELSFSEEGVVARVMTSDQGTLADLRSDAESLKEVLKQTLEGGEATLEFGLQEETSGQEEQKQPSRKNIDQAFGDENFLSDEARETLLELGQRGLLHRIV